MRVPPLLGGEDAERVERRGALGPRRGAHLQRAERSPLGAGVRRAQAHLCYRNKPEGAGCVQDARVYILYRIAGLRPTLPA